MKRIERQCKITELMPDNPVDGNEAWRLLEWIDEELGYPLYEVQRTEFVIEECGDLDTGPDARLVLGPWKEFGTGIGVCVLEKEIDYYHDMLKKEIG